MKILVIEDDAETAAYIANGLKEHGLGLSLVAAVVKLHDASISLQDNEPGVRVVIVFS
jgi:two-component sensor histidine kinase